jgi:hypothetical protein
MARGSKFASIFQQPPTAEVAEPDTAEPQPVAPRAGRPLGRPPGKRSDPAWKQFSVLLRRDTQREAANILREKGDGDFSGLVQSLVEGWLTKQRQ